MLEQIKDTMQAEMTARSKSLALEDAFVTKTGVALTAPQIFTMHILADQGMVNSGTLAAHLECSRGNVTGILDRLEALKLISRSRSAEDRRVVYIAATDSGIALMEKVGVYATVANPMPETVSA